MMRSSSTGRGQHAPPCDNHLPAIGIGNPASTAHSPSSATADNGRQQQLVAQQFTTTNLTGSDEGRRSAAKTWWDEVSRLHAEVDGLRTEVTELRQYRDDIKSILTEKNQALKQKDEVLERMRQEHREDMAKRDELYRKDMAKKDDQLANKEDKYLDLLVKRDDAHKADINRLVQEQLCSMQTFLSTAHAPMMPFDHHQRTKLSPAPPASLSAAPSSNRARKTQIHAPSDTDTLVTQLQAGGDKAVIALTAVLESALDALEALAMGMPRKQRTEVKAQCEKVEDVLKEVDYNLVGRLVELQMPQLMQLAEKLAAVQTLNSMGSIGNECLRVVQAGLDALEQCGDAVAGATRQLVNKETAVRMRGLQALQQLQRKVLDEAVAAEITAVELVLNVAMNKSQTDEERALALLGLYALGLRNGEAAVEMLAKFDQHAFEQIIEEVYEGQVHEREGAAMYIHAIAVHDLIQEIATKRSTAILDKVCIVSFSALTKASCPKTQYQELLRFFLDASNSDDVLIASAACAAMALPSLSKTGKEIIGAYLKCDPAVVAWRVRRRVVQPGQPAERWRILAQTLSVEGSCLTSLGVLMANVCMFVSPIPHDGVWHELSLEAIHLAVVNCEAKLSAQKHFSYWTFHGFFTLLDRLARDPTHHTTLMPCAKALLWASGNGWVWLGQSIAEKAANASVSLLGRNEGGLTLDKESVDCVLRGVHRYFDDQPTDDWFTKHTIRQPANKVTPKVQLLLDLVIADANKSFVLQHPHALNDLVIALLLDVSNPRRTQDGADTLQATAAKVLENLALSEPGKLALRSHSGAMAGLRVLKKDAMSDSARQSASAALFELDDTVRQKSKVGAGSSSHDDSSDIQHVMLSYNWNHQEPIKRLNLALKARNYNVWIDIEKMQGSTVEAMSAAVEGSAVMCYGISQAYKESTNCRLEAQYAFQQQLDMVPLVMEQGYRANGWLGMLLGVQLYYKFCGAVLDSEEAFDKKVGELCRELGERGKYPTV